MKIRFFMMVFFFFSQTANASNEENPSYGLSNVQSVVNVIVPFILTYIVHYFCSTSRLNEEQRSAGVVVAVETAKTLATAVLLKPFWVPLEKIAYDIYHPSAKQDRILVEKQRKSEVLLSILATTLPLIKNYLQENDTNPAIEIMANMMIRVKHLAVDLDVDSGLIVKDTVEAVLLNRTVVPCDFYADIIGKIREKDIRVRGENMTYYHDLLKQCNIPEVSCRALEQKGLVVGWKIAETAEQSCSLTRPEDSPLLT